MGNEMRCLLIARFRDMHFVPNPTRFSLFGVMRLWIIRRIDPLPSGGSIVALSPAQFSLFPKELLNPDTAQRLHSGYLPYPHWGAGSIDRLQQVAPIVAHDQSIRLTGGFAVGQSIVFDTMFVALDPTFLYLSDQPLWSCSG